MPGPWTTPFSGRRRPYWVYSRERSGVAERVSSLSYKSPRREPGDRKKQNPIAYAPGLYGAWGERMLKHNPRLRVFFDRPLRASLTQQLRPYQWKFCQDPARVSGGSQED
jgi:hypothetical protein